MDQSQIELKPFAYLVLATITAKSVLAPIINNTISVDIPGAYNQPVQIYKDPLTNVTAQTYTGTDDANRVSYNFQKLVVDYSVVTLDDVTYAAVEASQFDTLFFSADTATNYERFYSSMGAKIAAQIDTSIAALFDATTTGSTVTLGSAKSDVKGQGDEILSDIADQIDALDAAGIPEDGRFIVAGLDVAGRIRDLVETYTFSGDNANDALRKNTLGSIYGALVVRSAKIARNSVVVFQKDAYVLVTRPGGKLATAAYSETITDPSASIALQVNLVNLAELVADGIWIGTFSKVADIDSARRAVRRTYTFPTA